jgi:hypothetical protein
MAPRSASAQGEAGHGLALIAVDGKPPKPYAVGAHLDSDLVLQSVSLRTASLGSAQGAHSVLLELPALAPPNSGVLPPPGTSGIVPAASGSNRMQAAQAQAQAAQAQAAQALAAQTQAAHVQAAQAAQAAQAGQTQGVPGAAPGTGLPPTLFTPQSATPQLPLPPPGPSMPVPGNASTQ